MSLLEMHDVSKCYHEGENEVQAVSNVELSVERGARGGDGSERFRQVHAPHDRGQPRGTDER